MKKFNWLFLTLFAFVFIACDDDEATLDTINPNIVITSPVSGTVLNNDQPVQVTASVTDNLGLDEVTVWVTPPGGTAQQVHSESVSDFLNNNREADINETINLSTAAVTPGTYLITVRAVDERGNTAEESVSVSVLEADAVAPAIVINSPEENASFQAGSDMNIAADISDDMNLGEVNINVMAGNETAIYDSTITEFADGTLLNFQDSVTIPADAAIGTYTLSITATDVAGNETIVNRNFQVTEAGTGRITIAGIEEGQTLATLGDPTGVPVALNFTGEAGIDSVNVSARTVEGDREILNRGFNQAFFDENNIDNTGDFSFNQNLRFPNTSLARGANNLTVRSFRNGVMVGEQTVNNTLEPAEGTTETRFSATPASTLPEGSRVFTSGNFTAEDEVSGINDPGFELMEDAENPGTFATTVFADPNRNVNFRFSRMDADGTASFEVDENCVELAPAARTFTPATGTQTSVDVENVNFPGVGICQ